MAHVYAVAYTDCRTNIHAMAYVYTDTSTYCHGGAYADTYGDCANTDTGADSYGSTDPYSDRDPADGDAGSDSNASSNAHSNAHSNSSGNLYHRVLRKCWR